jgi:hypothetical protein
LRGVGAAAAQHVHEAEHEREEDGGNGDDDDKICGEVHLRHLRHREPDPKKNGRRKTADKSGRIGQEAHKQGRSESPAMQPKAARLMQFDDTCVA